MKQEFYDQQGWGGVRLFSACVYQILSLTNTEDFGLINVD